MGRMAEIRLLATDLDGTLIGSVNELPLYQAFRDKVNELRRRHNTLWVVCTGRSLRSFEFFFTPMRMMDIMPDYVIIKHAYIYGLSKFGYLPHLIWNMRTWHLLHTSERSISKVILDLYDMTAQYAMGVHTVQRKKDRLRLRFTSEETAVAVAGMLKEKAKPYKYLQVFAYGQEVDVRAVPFTKGLALSELAHHLGIPSDYVLAIGNGHNDTSMLDGTAAKLTGCPSNSEVEVMEVVHNSGGHIAASGALTGVMEILDAHMNGSVCSDLPAWWKNRSGPIDRVNISPSRSSQTRRPVASLALLFVCGYVVLLAFASFNLIPVFSRVIMFPFTALEWILEKIMGG